MPCVSRLLKRREPLSSYTLKVPACAHGHVGGGGGGGNGSRKRDPLPYPSPPPTEKGTSLTTPEIIIIRTK